MALRLAFTALKLDENLHQASKIPNLYQVSVIPGCVILLSLLIFVDIVRVVKLSIGSIRLTANIILLVSLSNFLPSTSRISQCSFIHEFPGVE